MLLDPSNIYLQTITAKWLTDANISLEVLRLDEIHPVVSGNKWFKLKHYLQQAQEQKKDTVATFGGAYSNHIIATAYCCKQLNLECVGFIRGEENDRPSHTLQYAQALGMQLIFVNRKDYQQKEEIVKQFKDDRWYIINEGGYGELGALGAAEILNYVDKKDYTHIIASTGTGTMLAGLVMAAHTNQQVIGISSMKGNDGLENSIKALLPAAQNFAPFTILHQYHFGGYAKHPPALIAFINEAWQQFNLPLDIVYTGKLLFAIIDLVTKNYFKPQSKLLMIHSGGLQGNKSLPGNQLSFS